MMMNGRRALVLRDFARDNSFTSFLFCFCFCFCFGGEISSGSIIIVKDSVAWPD